MNDECLIARQWSLAEDRAVGKTAVPPSMVRRGPPEWSVRQLDGSELDARLTPSIGAVPLDYSSERDDLWNPLDVTDPKYVHGVYRLYAAENFRGRRLRCTLSSEHRTQDPQEGPLVVACAPREHSRHRLTLNLGYQTSLFDGSKQQPTSHSDSPTPPIDILYLELTCS